MSSVGTVHLIAFKCTVPTELIKLWLNIPRRIEIRRYKIGHPYGILRFEPLIRITINILATVAEPDTIYAGSRDDLIAVSRQLVGTNKHIVVAYKETGDEGFIITAYVSSKINSLQKRAIIWKL